MDKQEAIKILKEVHDTSALFSVRTALETVFPELKEDEDELEWLKQFIQEEAYSLSMDIRDDEDRIKLKKLQRSLAWLEKQGEQKPIEWNERDERVLTEIINDVKFTQSKNPNSYMNQLLFKKEIDWLKSLKQRMGG